MHFSTIALFLYFLCTACASPLYLKARHDGRDALISRSLPSGFNTVLLHKRVDEMEQAVLDAWKSDKVVIIPGGGEWSLYRLKDPFENPKLTKLLANLKQHHSDWKNLYIFIETLSMKRNKEEIEIMKKEIEKCKKENDYLGSATRDDPDEEGWQITYLVRWSKHQNFRGDV